MRRLVNMKTEETVAPIEELVKKVGISFGMISLRADGFEITYAGENLSFAELAELSRVFGTRDISITSFNSGSNSDPCHVRIIIVTDATREV
jgi:hypothetical protein